MRLGDEEDVSACFDWRYVKPERLEENLLSSFEAKVCSGQLVVIYV